MFPSEYVGIYLQHFAKVFYLFYFVLRVCVMNNLLTSLLLVFSKANIEKVHSHSLNKSHDYSEKQYYRHGCNSPTICLLF